MNKDEQSNTKDYIGWLAPNGFHFACDSYGHDDLTIKILENYYGIKLDKKTVMGREDELYNKGWCRIGYTNFLDCGYTIQAKWRYITEEQKAFIHDMYFDVGNNMTEQTIMNLKDYEIIDLYQELKQTDSPIEKLKK